MSTRSISWPSLKLLKEDGDEELLDEVKSRLSTIAVKSLNRLAIDAIGQTPSTIRKIPEPRRGQGTSGLSCNN